jgi:hypothetical protein
MEININECLFTKDKLKQARFWYITELTDGFKTATGVISGNNDVSDYKEHTTPVSHNKVRTRGQQILYEMEARVKIKSNAGFKSIERDLNGTPLEDGEILDQRGVRMSLGSFLRTHLPEYKTDEHGYLKPMLARPYQESRKSNTFPKLAQPKINGVRCGIRWGEYTEGEGMFKTYIEGPILFSREGNRYRVPHIEKAFNDIRLFKTDDDQMLVYDGELYIHGESVNYIDSCVPMYNDKGTLSKASGKTELLEYWTFDLAIVAPQNKRISLLHTKYIHFLQDEEKVIRVPTEIIHNHTDAIMKANLYIERGFEGAILRDPEATYQFGVRGAAMEKVKKPKYTECRIIDVIPKPKEPETGIFILANDINDETFECNPMGTYSERKKYLDDKDNIIGWMVTVKFYERSGKKKCPFHANVVKIRNDE